MHQQSALDHVGVPYTLDKEEPYDLLHINTFMPASYFLAWSAREEGKAIVYHAHSTEEDFRNSFLFSNHVAPLFKKWIKKAYRLGDLLITPTPYSKRILEDYGLTQEIYAISNGIDLKQFHKLENTERRFYAKWNLDPGKQTVMGIGLYFERKGILDFIELARRMPDLNFIWFGYTNPKIVTQSVQQALKEDLPNLIFPRYVPNEEIRLALQGTDLYLFPTMEETEGIPAIEACAARTPMLVRDIPVFEGWLEDGKNCCMAKDVDGFEEKIRLILSGRLPRLTDEAYKVAEARDLPCIGAQLEKVYERAMELRDQRMADK